MTEMGGTMHHYLSPEKDWRNKQQQRIQQENQQQSITKGFTSTFQSGRVHRYLI